jgi:hypothetical protein
MAAAAKFAVERQSRWSCSAVQRLPCVFWEPSGSNFCASKGVEAMAKFDAQTLQELRDVRELRIRTAKHPKTAPVIWIVVADDEVFVRSWLGERGRWYRDLAAGGSAALEFAGRRLAVEAFPAGDAASVARASAAFLHKYQPSTHAPEMVRAETLSTTLRLEPG